MLYCIELNNNSDIIKINHLDNREYKFKIKNPILGFKYKIENLGLIKNTDTLERGNLFIIHKHKFKKLYRTSLTTQFLCYDAR